MRFIHTVCLSLTLGLGFTPALTYANDEPVVEQQPGPDSEIAPHVTDAKTDTASSVPQWGPDPLSTKLHIKPTDTGRTNPIPSDFNPRPSSQPGYPNM
jgi:hypothetical protein